MNTFSEIPALETPPLLAGCSDLPEWGLILVEGPDATQLLQSQLSNSVLNLRNTLAGEIARGHDAVRLAGYCSPKGRLLASAWLGLFPQEDESIRYGLFISKDIAAGIAKKLSMYVLRSKVTVKDVSHEWQITGLYDLSSNIDKPSIESDALALSMPDVLINEKSYSRLLIARPSSSSQKKIDVTALSEWNSLEVLSAIPRIVLATQEQFVPQMINFESVLGVDFKKGCYPGQEIVARSQYRGAVKRRLQLAHLKSAQLSLESYAPGTELYHSGDLSQPAGMVVLSAPNPLEPGRIDMQVECKLDALQNGDIHLGSISGPVLKIDALPYLLLEI
ncbi:hypothetical protein SAMN06295945_0896 [Polynucleobacter meluiroseus]|uniref:Aminomethyltransferase folate-binding domain-containing protein n=1 Tax=Polynucleobacter meluiroseus TaxID=1938814 RepID=A0A240E0Y2_9BURK|nr:folate-binding protein YgfZ [Polynucleobacter meluiroseus]SNX28564.1 hypothetical protein SAMN06295945_0896 [Polynucleobacter meluiroseus]